MQFGTRKELENEISSISAILSNPNNIWSDKVEAVSLELNLSHYGGGGLAYICSVQLPYKAFKASDLDSYRVLI